MELILRNNVILIVDAVKKSVDKITNPINRFDIVGTNLILRVDTTKYEIPLAGLIINEEEVTDADDCIEKLTVVFNDTNSGNGGSGLEIGGVYDTNADALADLGAGKLYQSSGDVNGSPQILYTV